MARMLGRARSAHDQNWCCPGHDPGYRPGMKELGRRAQRAREKQAVRREVQDMFGAASSMERAAAL
jgi:hypothetical protein